MKVQKNGQVKYDPPSIIVKLTVKNQDAGNMIIRAVPKDDATWNAFLQDCRNAVEKRLRTGDNRAGGRASQAKEGLRPRPENDC